MKVNLFSKRVCISFLSGLLIQCSLPLSRAANTLPVPPQVKTIVTFQPIYQTKTLYKPVLVQPAGHLSPTVSVIAPTIIGNLTEVGLNSGVINFQMNLTFKDKYHDPNIPGTPHDSTGKLSFSRVDVGTLQRATPTSFQGEIKLTGSSFLLTYYDQDLGWFNDSKVSLGTLPASLTVDTANKIGTLKLTLPRVQNVLYNDDAHLIREEIQYIFNFRLQSIIQNPLCPEFPDGMCPADPNYKTSNK